MQWTELGLSDEKVNALRGRYTLADPEEVLRLAWGAPQLLERVLSNEDVARLRDSHPNFAGAKYDSMEFKLGARFGAPLAAPDLSEEFEARRASLVARIDRARSPTIRSDLQSELVKLYSGKQVSRAN